MNQMRSEISQSGWVSKLNTKINSCTRGDKYNADQYVRGMASHKSQIAEII